MDATAMEVRAQVLPDARKLPTHVGNRSNNKHLPLFKSKNDGAIAVNVRARIHWNHAAPKMKFGDIDRHTCAYRLTETPENNLEPRSLARTFYAPTSFTKHIRDEVHLPKQCMAKRVFSSRANNLGPSRSQRLHSLFTKTTADDFTRASVEEHC